VLDAFGLASAAVERRKASAPIARRAAAPDTRGRCKDAPLGAPLPSLFAGSETKSFFGGVVVVNKTRAQRSVARMDFF
jgi:hypothetical protein